MLNKNHNFSMSYIALALCLFSVERLVSSGCTVDLPQQPLCAGTPFTVTFHNTTNQERRFDIIDPKDADRNCHASANGSCPIAYQSSESIAGTYSVKNSCGDNVTFNVSPLPAFHITGPDSVCKGSKFTLCAVSDDPYNAPLSYQWNTGATSCCIRVKDFQATEDFSVTVKDCNGCSATETKMVNAEACPHLQITKCAITQFGDFKGYKITICNTGQVAAEGIVVTDQLPSCASVGTITPVPNYTFTQEGNTLTFTRQSALQPGMCDEINIYPNTTNCGGQCFTNNAKVTSSTRGAHSKKAATCICDIRG